MNTVTHAGSGLQEPQEAAGVSLALRTRLLLRRTRLRELWVRHQHRHVRPDDVLLAAYPKSGSTWLRLVVGQLLVGEELDFDRTKTLVPIVGQDASAAARLPGGGRLLKTHERYRPVYRKAINLVRDVRDIAISYYYHQLRQALFVGGQAEFLEDFLAAKIDGYGRWDAHVLSWIDSPLARGGGLCLVRYEDLKADPAPVLRAIGDFLGVPFDDGAIAAAIEANTVGRMRQKERASTVLQVRRKDIPVVRAGKAHAWRTQLTPEQQALFLDRMGGALARLGYHTDGGART
jgi:hypothetical protein